MSGNYSDGELEVSCLSWLRAMMELTITACRIPSLVRLILLVLRDGM